jgi:hypothetical protein
MAWSIDARVPVVLGQLADADADDALLIEGEDSGPGRAAARFDVAVAVHAPECACCAPRTGAALALNRLFQARAKGEVPFFRRVVVVTRTAEGDMEVWSALRADQLTAARFRLAT